MAPTPVFVYGTLTDPVQVETVLDDWRYVGPGVLEGLHRIEGRYPTLAPDGRTAGRLLVTPELDRLDAYEAVETGLYVRVAVQLVDGDQAWVYVGDPIRLDASAAWPGEGPFADRVRRYLDEADVRVRRTGTGSVWGPGTVGRGMLEYDDVLEAVDRVEGVARHTPLKRSHAFSEMTGAEVHLKLENNQRTGAFKIRGATNRIETLSAAQREAGVVTASAGNHAQGVALAASRLGVDATIVMPEDAAVSKVEATRHYGAQVELHGLDYAEAAARAHELEAEGGLTYVHAFDDEAIMAGQGTVGFEIVEDAPDVDTVVVPIGGGGLIAGVATAVVGANPDARVVGVEPDGADSAARSLAAGEIVELDAVDTIADGLAARRVGDRTFEVIQERVDEVVTVSDSEIAVAVMLALERAKTLVEGAGAASLAALLGGAIDVESDEVVVPVLSGGNIDMNMLTTVLMRGLIETGRYLKIRTVLPDRPGALVELSTIIADHHANIYAFQHDRTSRDVGLNDAEVEVDIETRGPEHAEALLADLRERGYAVDVLQ